MKTNENKISAQEAETALEILECTKRNSIKSFRPPLWLNFLVSLFLGIETFAAPLSSGNSRWTFILLVSTAALLLSMTFWFIRLRQIGIKPKLVPVSIKDKIFSLVQGVLVAFLIMGSIELYKMGFIWVPYVAGPLNAMLMAYLLYSFPTGEWK